jgi:acetyltransferase-like isoleucine patch superfamily enzyme
VGRAWLVLLLRTIRAWDRVRLLFLGWRHPGLEIDAAASTNFASAEYSLEPGARLRIGPGAVTERRRGGVRFLIASGASVEIGADAWLRSELGTVVLAAFPGARIQVGPEAFLNGCHLSAKRELTTGRRTWIGPGSRIFDADQHDFDAHRPEEIAPVAIGDHVWIASDVTVLRGVRIGDHSVVGARSVVTGPIADHTLAFGTPARAHGRVGDRSGAR